MPDVRIGSAIGGYRIESLLGRGGMSVVYLAEHVRLGRKVALKLLPPELAENEGFRERFLRESTLAASIDHPNIVPIYDADEVDGQLFIAMRYVEGTDLRGLLKREGTLDSVRTLSIIEQTAGALDAAHARGLVHRDVKPGNILLSRREEPGMPEHVYLSDFGLTKRALSVSGLTNTGQMVGTIDYVAPEQIRGAAVDGRADLYSLGCVLFECLTGEPPFPRDHEVAVLWAHVQEPPPSLARAEHVPAGVDGVIQRVMAKEPEQRFASGRELVAELRASLGMEAASGARQSVTMPAPAAPQVPSSGRPKRRRRRVVGAIGLLVLAGTAGALRLTSGGGTAIPGVDTMTRIDGGSDAFGHPVHVGVAPTRVTFGESALWVMNQGDKTIDRIDPGSGTVTRVIAAPGTPTDIAAGDGEVWIATGFSTTEQGTSSVSMLDPRTFAAEPAFTVPSGTSAVAVGSGAVWAADPNGGQLFRFDPISHETKPVILGDGAAPSAIAVGRGAVWVADALNGKVYRVDPSGAHVATFGVKGATAVAVATGAVWVTSRSTGTVTRLDPATGATVATVRVPAGPTGIAVGRGGVWVACYAAAVVARIDPTTNAVVQQLKVDGSPDGLTADGSGNVWITVHAG